MSSTRPQRKATKRLYANDGAPTDLDVEMSEGEQQTTSKSKGSVDKGKGKSKTTKSKSKRAAAAVASDEEDELDSGSEVEQPTKKRKKTTKKKYQRKNGKQKKGKLELISTLPVELLAEICTHLTPGDLLALSFTSKAFRSLLISPASVSLWKASRRSVGLPDLTAGDMTEAQYAHLVFGTHCDICGCKETKLADFSLRKFLCNPCRQKNWVKLTWRLEQDLPHLHPKARLLTLKTPHSAVERRWRSWAHEYGFLPDLEAISDKLWELDPKAPADADGSEVEEDAELLRELLENDETHESTPTRTRQPRRPSMYGYRAPTVGEGSSLADDGDAEAEGESEAEDGDGVVEDEDSEKRRAALEAFVKDREELRKKAAEDGKKILDAVLELRKAARAEMANKSTKKWFAGYDRRATIKLKILDELKDYEEEDFINAPLWYSSKLINEGGPVTDESWEEIKPRVVKLLARIKAQHEETDRVNEQQARQRALLPRYKKLLDIQPNKESRHSLPLFDDFLHLPSVKELWETDEADPEDDEVWGEHLDAIIDELDEYRLDVRLQAVQTILAATTEMDEDELDGDVDTFGPDSYDDEWLARPTSFLVCSLPDCRDQNQRRYHHAGTFQAREPRPTFFGSLPDLLAHQHEHHSSVTFTDKQRKKREEEGHVGHYHLPPLVVSALSSIIELAGVKDEEATVDQLDELTRNSPPTFSWNITGLPAYLEWENSPSSKRYYTRWTELIEEALKQSEKAAKSISKRLLEVPTIVLHDRVADKEERQKERAKKRKWKGRKRAKRGGGRRRPWDYDSD
ncbi:hypothetical protein BCR35DRAFT_304398 [Leucosporidium creatinivorum]|uniref:F-box domain-containing protein n=1 Tax=Leucosporidium creatinivorum TaxID=106004 RepID=A0A1Y2F8L2_9BASI|nr:hypothetical protein BCR35DRAFT_304398 [Leucosporidium creatinivorum]